MSENVAVRVVKDMTDAETRATLARIFLKLEKINSYKYPQHKCLEDLRDIYKQKVIKGA